MFFLNVKKHKIRILELWSILHTDFKMLS